MKTWTASTVFYWCDPPYGFTFACDIIEEDDTKTPGEMALMPFARVFGKSREDAKEMAIKMIEKLNS